MRKKIVAIGLLGVVLFALRGSNVSSFNYNDTGLEKVVTEDLRDQPGEYAVYVKRLDTDTGFAFNKDHKFETASLYKLIVLATVFQFEKDGKLGLEDPLSSTYSVQEGMNRITTFSDNDSALMLTDMLRAGQEKDPLAEMAKSLGMESTDFSKELPETTAGDIGLFFEKLYHGEVVSKAASDRILDMLSKAESRDRIPAGVPDGVKIAHKTGELSSLRHDAGIVFLEGKPYVIVLMSQDGEVELLSKISKDVYNYWAK